MSHMMEKKLNYSQDVDWKQLVKLPQFAGTTPYYLGQMLNKMRNCVQQKNPEISAAEISAETLQWYLDSAVKKDEYKESFIQVYVILNNCKRKFYTEFLINDQINLNYSRIRPTCICLN